MLANTRGFVVAGEAGMAHLVKGIVRTAVVVLGILGPYTSAVGGVPGPKDAGGFFGSETLKTAAARVTELETQLNLPVLIETFPAIPAELRQNLDLLDVPVREKLFAEWAQDRLKRAGVDGVGLLLCKDPPRLQVALGEKARAKLFTPANRRTLVTMFSNAHREKRADEGLIALLRMIEESARVNMADSRASSQAEFTDEAGAGTDLARPEEGGLGRIHFAIAGAGRPGDMPQLPPQPPQEPEAPDWLDYGIWLLAIGLCAIVAIILLLLFRKFAPAKDAAIDRGAAAGMDA
jgi:hypothetical protein